MSEINWEKFYKYFEWKIKDSRPERWKYNDENIPSKYYTLDLDNDEKFNNPVCTECYEKCMYKSDNEVFPERYGNKGNCTCNENIGYDIKYKPLNKMKVRDCHIILDSMHSKNIKEYLSKVKMPFGKYKGNTICDMLEDTHTLNKLYYLFWLWRQGWCKGELKKALDVVRLECNFRWDDYICPRSFGGSADPYDTCPFNGYNEMGYGELC